MTVLKTLVIFISCTLFTKYFEYNYHITYYYILTWICLYSSMQWKPVLQTKMNVLSKVIFNPSKEMFKA